MWQEIIVAGFVLGAVYFLLRQFKHTLGHIKRDESLSCASCPFSSDCPEAHKACPANDVR